MTHHQAQRLAWLRKLGYEPSPVTRLLKGSIQTWVKRRLADGYLSLRIEPSGAFRGEQYAHPNTPTKASGAWLN